MLQVLEDGEAVHESTLQEIQVTGRLRQFEIPEMDHRLEGRLGDGVLLLGYDLNTEQIRPAEVVQVTLHWQALQEMAVSYTVFTHLLDPVGQIWGQMDSDPWRGKAPTTSWMVGEVITDPYEILVDADAPPGPYAIEIGMYDASTGRRLPAFVDGQREEGDRLLLHEVMVLP
jgi:hypothetical protein